MKTIKKYWAVIAGGILAIVAAIFVNDKLNKKKVTKLDKKLDIIIKKLISSKAKRKLSKNSVLK